MTETAVTTSVDPALALKVFDGIEFIDERLNTPDEVIAAQVEASIRLGHPQVWPAAVNGDRIALVGGGPSLEATFPELLDLVRSGAKLVTVNGSYRWCVERNLHPSAQVVVDARPSSAAFVDPEIPNCRYYIASQCHGSVWQAVAGRPFVGIWHAVAPESESAVGKILTAFYDGNWTGVAGATTVTTRAIGLLRMLGYLRFDLFGVDSCFMGADHHAYSQPENDRDARIRVTACPTDRPDLARDFYCAPWHLKQAEGLIQMVRLLGNKFLLNVHGDGLIAYLIRSSADVVLTKE